MKTLIFAILALAFTANAGNEGAQAVPSKPASVVAEYRMNGGFFVPPNMPVAYHYQILTNRKVVKTTYFKSSRKPETKVLKTLTGAEWARLAKLVSQVKPGKTFDPSPEFRGCMDAPSFSWRVQNAKGEIVISEKRACKTMSRENASLADKEIIEILNTIADLDKE